MNRQNTQDGYRICVTCKTTKPMTTDYYYRDKNRMGGLMYRCKDCDKNRPDNRDSYLRWLNSSPETRARIKENNIRYRKTDKGRAISLVAAYRTFDKERGYENDIIQKDILLAKDDLCTYCGSAATGFDRLDNKKGHTKRNCVPCCTECNVARMDNFTTEEMHLIGNTIRDIKCARELKELGNCVF